MSEALDASVIGRGLAGGRVGASLPGERVGASFAGGPVGASFAGGPVGASFAGGPTGRRWPETLRAHPCALDGGHPWPPTFRPAPPRHPALNVVVNSDFWRGARLRGKDKRLLLSPLQRAAVEAVWGWGRSCGTVGGHGWPPPSLHGRTRGGSRSSGPAATLPEPHECTTTNRAHRTAVRNNR